MTIRPRLRHRGLAIVLVLAFGFFFGPTLAYLSGHRPKQIENRRLAAFPSIHDGWSALPKLGNWATDHLSGRDTAVKANNDLTEKVFQELPSAGGREAANGQADPATGPGPALPGTGSGSAAWPQVIQGKDGWLFLGLDVLLRCRPAPIPQTLANLARLSNAVTRSGRHFEFVVAPDKTSAYPQNLPKSFVGSECNHSFTEKFWQAFDANPTPGYVDVRKPLLQLSKTSPELIYRPRDTHWSPLGAVIYAQLLAAGLDPDLAQGTAVDKTGNVELGGDLSLLLGNLQKDAMTGYKISRAGVVTSSLPPYGETLGHVSSTTTSAPLYRPRTLVLGDSFTGLAEYAFAPYFADLDVVDAKGLTTNPDPIIASMIKSDTIVVEIAERAGITGLDALMGRPAILNRVISTIQSHPKK